MIPHPTKLLSTALIVAIIASISALIFSGWSAFAGVVVASAILWINLVLWKVVVQSLIQQSAYGTAPKMSALFFILKIGLLSVGLFVLSMLLSPIYVFIANTVIVLSLIGVSLSTAYKSRLR
jgi:hypothetical protein